MYNSNGYQAEVQWSATTQYIPMEIKHLFLTPSIQNRYIYIGTGKYSPVLIFSSVKGVQQDDAIMMVLTRELTDQFMYKLQTWESLTLCR